MTGLEESREKVSLLTFPVLKVCTEPRQARANKIFGRGAEKHFRVSKTPAYGQAKVSSARRRVQIAGATGGCHLSGRKLHASAGILGRQKRMALRDARRKRSQEGT